MNFRH